MENSFFTTSTKSSAIIAGVFTLMTTTAAAQPVNFKPLTSTNDFSKSGSLVKYRTASNDDVIEIKKYEVKSKLPLNNCPEFIKNKFNLNITDLAKIFHVSRPTAYKYLNGDIAEDNTLVVDELYSLAEYWKEKSNDSSIGMELKRQHGGESLFNLMENKEYDQAYSLIEIIAESVISRGKRVSGISNMAKHNSFSPDMTRKSVDV
jgi:hypothetical protein